MGKNSSFYINACKVNVKELKPSCVHDVTWQFDLGMHLFRFFERETRRVRRSGMKARDVKAQKAETKCEKASAIGKDVGRRVVKHEGPLTLPFTNSKRSAARRRQRIKSDARLVPEKGTKVLKNPVKVSDVSSEDTWHHREILPRTGKWIYCTEHHCVGPCEADVAVYPRCQFTKTPLNRCRYQTVTRNKYLKNRKTYVRWGANRVERRRNWFGDRILKRLPRKLLASITKSKLSTVMHKWMSSPIKTPPNILKRMIEERVAFKPVLRKSRHEIDIPRSLPPLFRRGINASGTYGNMVVRCIALGAPRLTDRATLL